METAGQVVIALLWLFCILIIFGAAACIGFGTIADGVRKAWVQR